MACCVDFKGLKIGTAILSKVKARSCMEEALKDVKVLGKWI